MITFLLLCLTSIALADSSCPENSHFNPCGTDCPLTCENYQNPPDICNLMCRIGCECDDGYVLKSDGSCSLSENCATQTCPPNSRFNSCGTYCPLTCKNYQDPPEMCIMMCKTGCECESGYVLEEDGNCVLPEDCANDTALVCRQPLKVGPCRALMPRFYYNPRTKMCEEFYYGGCQGNDNNFKRLEDCVSTCSECPAHSRFESCGSACPLTCNNYRNPPRFCILRCDIGCHCEEGYVLTDDKRCVLPHECEMNAPHLPFACQQDKEVGACGQNFSRFFYNRTSSQCQEFIYGGCQGNDNNFQSLEDCDAVCQVQQAPHLPFACQQDKEVGACGQNFSRFFYNRTSSQCQEFIYGGCQGNDNNFQSLEDCYAVCQIEQVESNMI